MRTVYMTATSLDGFIADENNSLDWLFSADSSAVDEPTHDFIANVGRS